MFGIWVSQKKNEALQHSAKGSSWKKHKYIKKIDGTYYYPSWYEGGRHLDDTTGNRQGDGSSNDDAKKNIQGGANDDMDNVEDLRDSDIEELARMVIAGRFGNGATRKELLGDDYQRIQDKVNEMLLGDAYKQRKTEVDDTIAKLENNTTTLTDGINQLVNTAEKAGRDPLQKALLDAAAAGLKIGSGIGTASNKSKARKRERDKKGSTGVKTNDPKKRKG